MKRLLVCSLLSPYLVSTGCITVDVQGEIHGIDQPGHTGFINQTMSVDGEKRKYVVYVPHAYTPDQKWPLVVFLHGMGERGDDGLLQTEVGIGPAIRKFPDRYQCLVVMPQCPDDTIWTAAEEHIEEAIEETMEDYDVDRDRVYLTGLSMGGFGTWHYGADNAEEFAALVPICGGGNVDDAEELADLPIWVFHGADDPVVSPEQSRTMFEAIKAEGGDIRYTEFEDTGHNSWDKAYQHPDLMDWLLEQER